jgi:hypothetical protein
MPGKAEELFITAVFAQGSGLTPLQLEETQRRGLAALKRANAALVAEMDAMGDAGSLEAEAMRGRDER